MKNIADYFDYVRKFLSQYATEEEVEMLMMNIARCISAMSPDEKSEYGVPQGA